MLQSYTLSESGSNEVVAVIQDIDKTNISSTNTELVGKVNLAIKEHECLDEMLDVIPESIKKVGTKIKMTFKDDDGIEISVDLKETVIY